MMSEPTTAHPARSQILARAHTELRHAMRHLRGVSTFLAEAGANTDRLRSATHHLHRAAHELDGLGGPWLRDVDHIVPPPPTLPDALVTVGQVLVARRALEATRDIARDLAAEHAALDGDVTLPALPDEDLPRPLAEVGLWVSLATVFTAIAFILAGFVAAGIALAVAAMVVLGLVRRALS